MPTRLIFLCPLLAACSQFIPVLLAVGHTSFEREGRHAALEDAAIYMQQFFFNPGVLVDDKTKVGVLLEKPGQKPGPGEHIVRADLIQVSSHGWLGGFARGNEYEEWPDAEPAVAQNRGAPTVPYFLIGAAAKDGAAFHGPRWVVLAQCSTVCEATWPSWVQIMARSDPPVTTSRFST